MWVTTHKDPVKVFNGFKELPFSVRVNIFANVLKMQRLIV
jgi:hypothetical protein